MKLFTAVLLAILTSAQTKPAENTKVPAPLNFTMNSIDGKAVNLAKYQGRVVLMVNVASECGYTPQYAGLEELHKKYVAKGLSILGFPANDFGAQEPGTNEQIKEFCTTHYKVSFPIFSKIVVDGQKIHPLYQFLTSDATNPKFAGRITWNFAKFLVNRKGEVVDRFEPGENPSSEKVTGAIERTLAEK